MKKKITRRESILTLASGLTAGGVAVKAAAQAGSGSGKAPPASAVSSADTEVVSQSPQTSQADQDFQSFVDRYFEGFFRFNPSQATRAGIHQYDAELPAYSASDIQAEIQRNHHALWALGKISGDTLSPANQFDSRLLESLIRGHLLDLADIRMWAKDPNFYNNIASRSLFGLVEREFAPVDDRLKSLIARAERIPELLNSARANVVDPPGIATQVAIEQVQSQIGFLQSALPQFAAGAASSALEIQFNTANQQLLAAYGQFLEYLKGLVGQSRGQFAIGSENFRKMLLYDEMVDTPIVRLLEIGHKELRRTQSLLIQTAKIIDANSSPLEVLRGLSQQIPEAKQVLKDVQSEVNALVQFVQSHDIVTIPPAPIPQVKETPPFLQALTFASMDSPGPLEKNSIQSFFYLTLPGTDWSATQRQQLLQFFNPYSMRIISTHEVYPGHYVQLLWLARAATRARKLEPSLKFVGTNIEGWAHYCEGMMLEQGYGEGDPKLLLAQLQAALIRLCRYIAAIRLHTQGMTIDEAVDFFQTNAYMEPTNARREAKRGALDPGYLVYTLGKLEILKLREDLKQKLGEKFNLRDFHDRFLSFGIAPVKMIREQMLEENSPAL